MTTVLSERRLPPWMLVDVPLVPGARGNLCFLETDQHVPFPIERVYWIYSIPEDAQRGGHAHRSCQELLVPTVGQFDVHCDDGINRDTFHLDDPSRGLLLAPEVWRELDGFSPGSMCLVLASRPYEAGEYIHDYTEFAVLATEKDKPYAAP